MFQRMKNGAGCESRKLTLMGSVAPTAPSATASGPLKVPRAPWLLSSFWCVYHSECWVHFLTNNFLLSLSWTCGQQATLVWKETRGMLAEKAASGTEVPV